MYVHTTPFCFQPKASRKRCEPLSNESGNKRVFKSAKNKSDWKPVVAHRKGVGHFNPKILVLIVHHPWKPPRGVDFKKIRLCSCFEISLFCLTIWPSTTSQMRVHKTWEINLFFWPQVPGGRPPLTKNHTRMPDMRERSPQEGLRLLCREFTSQVTPLVDSGKLHPMSLQFIKLHLTPNKNTVSDQLCSSKQAGVWAPAASPSCSRNGCLLEKERQSTEQFASRGVKHRCGVLCCVNLFGVACVTKRLTEFSVGRFSWLPIIPAQFDSPPPPPASRNGRKLWEGQMAPCFDDTWLVPDFPPWERYRKDTHQSFCPAGVWGTSLPFWRPIISEACTAKLPSGELQE